MKGDKNKMLWVLLTDKILPSDKPGLIIMMAISMLVNVGIMKLVELRCGKRKNRR